VTAREVETPLTVQPCADVMARRNVFEVTGAERVVDAEQFMRRPDATPVALVR
jgi:hypothetical protein